MAYRYEDASWDTPEKPESDAVQDGAAQPAPRLSGGNGAIPNADASDPPHSANHANRIPPPDKAGSMDDQAAESGSDGGRRGAAPQRLAQPRRQLPRVTVGRVSIHAVTAQQSIEFILEELDAGRGGMVVTPNLDHLRRCRTDHHFAALVDEAELVVADGTPVVWASRLQGASLPERVAGSDLIFSLSEAAALRGRSIYLLGGDAGTDRRTGEILATRYPGLNVVGCHSPSRGFENHKRMIDEIRTELARRKPDIVYVALGSPKQERLIAQLRDVLPGAWWLGVGISFSFVCGDVKRAPVWMQKSGLEWTHRMVREPRLIKRYVWDGIPFAAGLLTKAAIRGVGDRAKRWVRPAASPGANGSDDAARLIPGHAASAEWDLVEPSLESGEGDDNANASGTPSISTEALPPAPEGPRLLPDDSGLAMAAVSGPVELIRLSRLRGLILLGGSVRTSPLSLATGRSVLDLPLDERGSMLNYWLGEAVEVARAAGLDRLPMRVLVSRSSLEPTSADERYYGPFRVERDRSELRGTGGVLGDLASEYEDDDLLLIANAQQILLDPLAALAMALHRKGGDMCLVSHDDGTPSGLMLVTCKTLRIIPSEGFVDMKEQVLPRMSEAFDVRVMRRRRPSGVPVRTLEDYVQGLRFHHRRRANKPITTDPLGEDFTPAFSLIEPGAVVDSSAGVHDSVVLSGGTVEPGAVLVRCVVCPGATVRGDRTEVDRFITAGSRGRRR